MVDWWVSPKLITRIISLRSSPESKGNNIRGGSLETRRQTAAYSQEFVLGCTREGRRTEIRGRRPRAADGFLGRGSETRPQEPLSRGKSVVAVFSRLSSGGAL